MNRGKKRKWENEGKGNACKKRYTSCIATVKDWKRAASGVKLA